MAFHDWLSSIFVLLIMIKVIHLFIYQTYVASRSCRVEDSKEQKHVQKFKGEGRGKGGRERKQNFENKGLILISREEGLGVNTG